MSHDQLLVCSQVFMYGTLILFGKKYVNLLLLLLLLSLYLQIAFCFCFILCLGSTAFSGIVCYMVQYCRARINE